MSTDTYEADVAEVPDAQPLPSDDEATAPLVDDQPAPATDENQDQEDDGGPPPLPPLLETGASTLATAGSGIYAATGAAGLVAAASVATVAGVAYGMRRSQQRRAAAQAGRAGAGRTAQGRGRFFGSAAGGVGGRAARRGAARAAGTGGRAGAGAGRGAVAGRHRSASGGLAGRGRTGTGRGAAGRGASPFGRGGSRPGGGGLTGPRTGGGRRGAAGGLFGPGGGGSARGSAGRRAGASRGGLFGGPASRSAPGRRSGTGRGGLFGGAAGRTARRARGRGRSTSIIDPPMSTSQGRGRGRGRLRQRVRAGWNHPRTRKVRKRIRSGWQHPRTRRVRARARFGWRWTRTHLRGRSQRLRSYLRNRRWSLRLRGWWRGTRDLFSRWWSSLLNRASDPRYGPLRGWQLWTAAASIGALGANTKKSQPRVLTGRIIGTAAPVPGGEGPLALAGRAVLALTVGEGEAPLATEVQRLKDAAQEMKEALQGLGMADVGMLTFEQCLKELGPSLLAVADGMQALRDSATEEQPLDGSVLEFFGVIGDATHGAAEVADEMPGLFRAAHSDELARLEAPRRNEHRWDLNAQD
ncbi:hypothetical protein KIK06_29105 [Nocardiopsis sp. EMB25]|uniref:hypothetical protein n=1 Tax=Nocardiopsis sp. EMB25 TaxID=2835867 RepID=UPI00228446C3|nr:hypothetical protein [Nocardiopsis sp. EMB25]MCY9787943.1 hypothetical protein [Nocardiopsis sp. EMB25]